MADTPEKRQATVSTIWQRLPITNPDGENLWFAIIPENELDKETREE